MIWRAVRFENWKTPSMISRFSSERIPAFSECARMSRNSSCECTISVSLAGLIPTTRSTALVVRFSSQITGYINT